MVIFFLFFIFLALEARDELDKVIKIEQKINKHDLIYKSR